MTETAGLARPIPDLRLFDCLTRAGFATVPAPRPALNAEDLLAEMDFCGLDEALVQTDAGDIASPLVTNPELVQLCAPHARLHPMWNILPPATGEMLPDQLFARMKRDGVKALAAYPDKHRYLLNGLTFGALFEPMIERRIPLFLEPNWRRITAVLMEFPKLIVVATNLGCWGSDRFVRPLFEHFAGFHIETSSMEVDGGIPGLAARYGPERILFGSGFPHHPAGGPVAQLRSLDLEPDVKKLIAHGNLERLLAEVRL